MFIVSVETCIKGESYPLIGWALSSIKRKENKGQKLGLGSQDSNPLQPQRLTKTCLRRRSTQGDGDDDGGVAEANKYPAPMPCVLQLRHILLLFIPLSFNAQ